MNKKLVNAKQDAILWIDLEMTGLDPDHDSIIEIATVVTDRNLAAVQALGYARREDILQHPSRLSPQFQPDGRASFDKAEEMM